MPRRFALLIPVLVLSVVLAAPVPKPNPLTEPSLSAATLAKLPFVNADTPDEDHADHFPRPKQLALAVHVPRPRVRHGEPVIALFAVKNRTAHPLGLDMRLDLSGLHPALMNSCDIEVRNTESQELVPLVSQKVIACGAGGGMVSVPAGGYYAVRGNVGHTADGEPLPPGGYELSWRYGWAKSNAVAFTVLARGETARPPEHPHTRVVRVSESSGDEPKKGTDAKAADAPPVWANPGLRVDHSALLTALATGEFGRYYPNVRDLPTADGGVTATAAWDGDKLTVKLEAAGKGDPAVERPAVYLLIACDETGPELELQAEDRAAAMADGSRRPFTLEIRLPKDWKDRTGAHGEGRVAVVLAGREPPGRGERVKRVKGDTDWVVRTDWRAVTFPKRERDGGKGEKPPGGGGF